ncbi:unnamed protein product [Hymenolepis diminuta]|uniref:Uncharacterized protein n=1 Tax=Hymenolepis diminuta TaxID=6216 RepID=A0A564YB06_HYMDI|nr:unnamed protein product [Hymenolepis diminuta]
MIHSHQLRPINSDIQVLQLTPPNQQRLLAFVYVVQSLSFLSLIKVPSEPNTSGASSFSQNFVFRAKHQLASIIQEERGIEITILTSLANQENNQPEILQALNSRSDNWES